MFISVFVPPVCLKNVGNNLPSGTALNIYMYMCVYKYIYVYVYIYVCVYIYMCI